MQHEELSRTIAKYNWPKHWEELDNQGYTHIPSLLNKTVCKSLISDFNNEELFRSRIDMRQFNFGKGQYNYYRYPLPAIIQSLREKLYLKLFERANEWMRKLNISIKYPGSYDALLKACISACQFRPTPLILAYEKGDYNNLHQDLYGQIFFPFQAVIMLSEPEKDYKGGEFVITEQMPRRQTKPIVLKPGLGDVIIFTTNFRLIRGKKGYFKAVMKHGVSAITDGQRFALGIVFHDAA